MSVTSEMSVTCLSTSRSSAAMSRSDVESYASPQRLIAMMGTSSIDRTLASGVVAPGGSVPAAESSFWFRRTSARSASSPTRNRAMIIERPGLDVE